MNVDSELTAISCGSQLKYGYLDHMNWDKLRVVINACPNARFRLDLGLETFPARGLKIVGPRLDAITLWGC